MLSILLFCFLFSQSKQEIISKKKMWIANVYSAFYGSNLHYNN